MSHRSEIFAYPRNYCVGHGRFSSVAFPGRLALRFHDMARPRKSPDARLSSVISTPLTPAECEALKAFAAREERPVSYVVRQAIKALIRA